MRPRGGGNGTPDGLSHGTLLRLARGGLAGAVATATMALTLLWMLEAGLLTLPEMPAFALADQLLPSSAGAVPIGLLALTLELTYGAFWGAVLSVARVPVTVGSGLVLGAVLWGIEVLLVFPMIGWGLLAQGLGAPSLVAITSLGLHLLYGLVAGGLLAWQEPSASEPPA